MKKILCLIICLALTLTMLCFASCGNNEVTNEGLNGGNNIVDDDSQGGTENNGGNQNGTDNQGGNQGGAGDNTGDDNQGGNGDNTGDDNQGGNGDNTGDDNQGEATETVTIKFTCVVGTLVSGAKEVKINKGSTLLPNQMPVYQRNGYVILWSYDKFGDEPWKADDEFTNDTTLFATWHEAGTFEGFKALVSYLNNFQLNTEIVTTLSGGMEFEQSEISMYDGLNVYSNITTSDMEDEMWYVDGVFYTLYGDEFKKQTITAEEFDEIYGGYLNGSTVFGIDKNHVSAINVNNEEQYTKYVLTLDAGAYTESIAGTVPVELIYNEMIYTFSFDKAGNITGVTVEIAMTVDGISQSFVSNSYFSGIGTTVVEAPAFE